MCLTETKARKGHIHSKQKQEKWQTCSFPSSTKNKTHGQSTQHLSYKDAAFSSYKIYAAVATESQAHGTTHYTLYFYPNFYTSLNSEGYDQVSYCDHR